MRIQKQQKIWGIGRGFADYLTKKRPIHDGSGAGVCNFFKLGAR
jgi:hypothetical protein